MPKQNLSVENGLRIAAKRPSQCAVLMAKYLYPLLTQEAWFNKELRIKFCLYFLRNLCDMSIEKEVDKALMARVKSMQLKAGLSLLKKHPQEGVKVLVAVIANNLREEQKLSITEQQVFYNELFGKFFPESRLFDQQESWKKAI